MAKNLIPEVCKMLGVEVGEEFKIGGCGDKIFMLTINGLEGRNLDRRKLLAVGVLQDLLIGVSKIIKLPWKPKDDEKYWTFGTYWRIEYKWWHNNPCDAALLAKGWVYRTAEEAAAALPKVAEELGAKYEL